jgi:hypothetical protein
MAAELKREGLEVPDDTVTTPDGWLIPTFDELREINDDPTVDFENSDVSEDDDDRAGVL